MIYNCASDKAYIGQSKCLDSRRRSHFSNLRNNKHPNIHLQSSFNKYGEECFNFIPLENCQEEELTEREVYYALLLDESKRYNLASITPSLPISEETRKKFSDSRKGKESPRKGSTLSQESKDKISSSLKSNPDSIKRALENIDKMNSDPEIIRRRTKTRRENYVVSEETKKLLSDKTKKFWQDKKEKEKETKMTYNITQNGGLN